MLGPLSRLLGLTPEEMPPVLRLALVFGVIGAAVAIGDATVQAIFIARAGADRLPEVLIARALLSPAVAFLYARFARPRAERRVLVLLVLLAAAGALIGRLLIDNGESGALYAYVIHEVLASVITVHWGVYLLANLRGDHALRGTPAVYAAARLGAALGGAALAPLVSHSGASVGLYAVAALFFLAALFAAFGRAPRDGNPLPPSEPPPPAAHHDAEAPAQHHLPLRYLFASPLLAALALATAAMVFVRFTLRYQQQALLEPIEEHELAQLLAVYTAVANGLGAAFQLGLLGRILTRIGLTATNTFYAAATIVAQLALLFAPGVPAALGARFADSELKHAIKTPLSSLFYEAFPSRDRGAARAFILGAVSPAAQLLGALGLATAIGSASLETLGYAGLAATLLFGVATLAQNRAYVRARNRE